MSDDFDTDEDERARLASVVLEILKQAQRLRLPPPPLLVEPATHDPTDPFTVEVACGDDLAAILGGASAPGPAPFQALVCGDFPVLQRLYRRFVTATPPPRIVRLDTIESDAAFRDARRAPYLADLDTRLTALEQKVAEHVADHHGGGRLAELERRFDEHVRRGDPHEDEDILGEEAARAVETAKTGGSRIPLSLPPASADKVECWQDGDEILCSIKLPGPDGRIRIATTGSPAERHVEEAVTYAEEAGIAPVDVVGILPVMAQSLGGGALVTQLAAAAPHLLSRPEVLAGAPFVGRVTPRSDPALAATAALEQLRQRGHAQAANEMARLAAIPEGAVLVGRAVERLARGQREKQARMLRRVL